MQRREFLKTSAAAGIAAWTALSAAHVPGANGRLRIGLIGCGPRGMFDARNMRGAGPNPRHVEIAAVCDADPARTRAARRCAPHASAYADFRHLLADRTIDAVIIATPPPCHAPMLILACEAAKDVYLETPVMCRLAEAQPIREAVRRTGRIVQIGSQFRSAAHIAEAARIVQSGRIGPVKFVRAWNHCFDSVHQIMGADMPLTVSAAKRGLARISPPLRNFVPVPALLLDATYAYPDFVLSSEVSLDDARHPPRMAFHGAEATLFVDRAGLELYPGGRLRQRQPDPSPLHAQRFVDCVRTRRHPLAGIEVATRAAAIACLANVAAWTGRKLTWDAASWHFPADPDANQYLFRE